MRSSAFLLVLASPALAFLALANVACSKLTEPPRQEMMAEPGTTDTTAATTTVAAAPTPPPTPAPAPTPAPPPPDPNAKVTIKDVAVGKGTEAKAGDTVRVQYVGKLQNGTEFDASLKHGKDGFTFPLGAGKVIKGWDQGVAGMKPGGKRHLTIPPELGYGARGAGASIPPNSTLEFDVELVEIVKK